MPVFAYRILPPRPDFAATMGAGEAEIMRRHFAFLQALEAEGRVIFVGRCENGDWGLGVFDFPDEAAAQAALEADPAVASGLMRMELHPFHIAMERGGVPQAVGAEAAAR